MTSWESTAFRPLSLSWEGVCPWETILHHPVHQHPPGVNIYMFGIKGWVPSYMHSCWEGWFTNEISSSHAELGLSYELFYLNMWECVSVLVLQEWEFSLSLEDSSARGNCLAQGAWREWEAGRGLRQKSCWAAALLLFNQTFTACLGKGAQQSCWGFLPWREDSARWWRQFIYFFPPIEIIASSPGECGLASCTAGRSSSGLADVNKTFI